MRMRSRLLRLSWLLPAALLLGLGAEAAAQDAHAHMDMGAPAPAPSSGVKPSLWSDPKSWPGGKVPGAGEAVTIGRDRNVVLDVSPPALRSLTVNGKLSFSNDKDLELTTEWIYLPGGELDIGSEAKPHTRKATITLTDTVKDENINTMGDRGIMMLGGTLSLHGGPQERLDQALRHGQGRRRQDQGAERRRLAQGRRDRPGLHRLRFETDGGADHRRHRRRHVTLDQPLKYMHFGRITDGVDERGEVGLLTRNILIHASDDAEKSYFGGHIMAMAGSKMYVSGVELARMGQNMHLARYPIHWHIEGRRQGPVHREFRDPRHLQPLRHGARHQQPAHPEQRHLQHRGPLLLHGRRRGDRQPVHPQPGHDDQVPSRR
ncbi:MAG: G8 domain-containing protein [Caulobacteraceae bacterium]